MALSQRCFQILQRWVRPHALQAEGANDGGENQHGILKGGERNEADPVGEVLLNLAGKVQSEACLPTPPGPMRVSKRTSACRSMIQTAAISCSLPMREVSGNGSSAKGLGAGSSSRVWVAEETNPRS